MQLFYEFDMDLSKENRISQLLSETARCGLRDASLRDVAIDYFTHDSDRVSIFGTSRIRSRPTSFSLLYRYNIYSNHVEWSNKY